MKSVMRLSFSIALASFIALPALSAKLLTPPERCPPSSCAAPSFEVQDQYQRCGCLTENDYYQLDQCNKVYRSCDRQKGELPTAIKEKWWLEGGFTWRDIGCGCFATER